MHRRDRTQGFTLVEMMIVMALILILGAIAWPNYSGHMARTRRLEGQVALIEAMQQQERFQSLHNTYVAFSAASQPADAHDFKWWSGREAATSAYELEAHACADDALSDCVEISARPGTGRVDARFHDPDCGVLTLDSRGRQGAQAAPDSPVHCWP